MLSKHVAVRRSICGSVLAISLGLSQPIRTSVAAIDGSTDTKPMAVCVFDEKVKCATCAKQTQAAERKGVSNCPLCAIGNTANKTRIYEFDEMDADHVTTWSKGDGTSASNCDMLCSTHNRAKGN